MGSQLSLCKITPKVNEQIEALIKLNEEDRAVIHGTVVNKTGKPIENAVVKLLQVVKGCDIPYPLTHTFTDKYGQFLLGPVRPDKKYIIKVYKNTVSTNYLSLEEDNDKDEWTETNNEYDY